MIMVITRSKRGYEHGNVLKTQLSLRDISLSPSVNYRFYSRIPPLPTYVCVFVASALILFRGCGDNKEIERLQRKVCRSVAKCTISKALAYLSAHMHAHEKKKLENNCSFNNRKRELSVISSRKMNNMHNYRLQQLHIGA